jgi:hypothetical protein
MSRTCDPAMFGSYPGDPYQTPSGGQSGPRMLSAITGVNGPDVSAPTTASAAQLRGLTPVTGEVGTGNGAQTLPSSALHYTGNPPDTTMVMPSGSGIVVTGLSYLYTADGAPIAVTGLTAGSHNAATPRPAGRP